MFRRRELRSPTGCARNGCARPVSRLNEVSLTLTRRWSAHSTGSAEGRRSRGASRESVA